jgi:short subunit dehydrogenase-like uncharacterized protein
MAASFPIRPDQPLRPAETMTGMRTIGLLGATGYTGRLTATEFALRDVAVRLGARNPDRLAAVDGVDSAERVVVDTADPKALAGFLDGLDVVVSTVGPFALYGKPVVDAAVRAGVHYVDSTGEPDFIKYVYETYAGAQTAVVPACGFDYVPGDCGAAVAAAQLDRPAEQVTVGYSIRHMVASRGTARSSIEAIATQSTPRLGRTSIEGRPAIVLPWGEDLTVPLWAPQATVTCAMTAPRLAAAVAPVVGRLAMPALKVGAPLLRRFVERLPEGPSDATRAAAKTRVVATASAGGRSATVAVDVDDVYGFTAVSLVEFALQVDGAGALAPSQAADPTAMLDALSGPLLKWQQL